MDPNDPAFIKLTESVERIELALLGDAMEGRKGIIHWNDQMKEDLYAIGPDGNPIEGKSNTLLNRVSNMEEKQKKALWIFSGIAFAIVAVKSGITAVIDKIWTK
jgi:hypothetical protein